MSSRREDLYNQVESLLEIEAELGTSTAPDSGLCKIATAAALYSVCDSLLRLDPERLKPEVAVALQACLIESQQRLVSALLLESAFGNDGVSNRTRLLGATLDSLARLPVPGRRTKAG